MKKWALIVLTFLGCKLYALPIGSPNETCLYQNGLIRNPCCSDPCGICFTWFEGWNVRAGYWGDFVYNRHLSARSEDPGGGRDVELSEVSTNAALIVVNLNNLCRSVDLFATFGVSDFHTMQDITVFTDGGALSGETNLWFKSAFSWSVGARTALLSWSSFTWGIEGQYFSSSPDIDRFDRGSVTPLNFFERKGSHFEEWQVGSAISYLISTKCPSLALSPYAGIKYSRTKWDLGDAVIEGTTTQFGRFSGRKHWGWALGLSFTMHKLIGITVEGRFADEKAFHVKGQARF